MFFPSVSHCRSYPVAEPDPQPRGRGLFCLPCGLFFLLWFVLFLPQITGRGANSPRSATGIDEQWIRSLEAIRGKHAVRNCFIFRVWIFETPGGTAFWVWGQSFRGTRAQSDFVNNVIYWQNVVFFEEIKFWKKSNTSIVFQWQTQSMNCIVWKPAKESNFLFVLTRLLQMTVRVQTTKTLRLTKWTTTTALKSTYSMTLRWTPEILKKKPQSS